MMPPPGLPHFVYCRPHSKTITPQMRFVVRTCRGIDTGERQFKEGEEFPGNAVNEYTLRCLYEQLKIDLMPAPAGEAAPPPVDPPKDFESLNYKQLQELCAKFELPSNGSKAELRERLFALAKEHAPQ